MTDRSITVHDAITSRVLRHLPVSVNQSYIGNGNGVGATFDASGSGIYYCNVGDNTVYHVELATGQTDKTAIVEPGGAGFMKASSNGRTLIYVTHNPTSSRDMVCVYDIASNKVTKKWNFTSTLAANDVVSLDFLANGTQIVTNGPTIYDLAGTRLFGINSRANPVAVSPDGLSVYTISNNGKAVSYSASNLTLQWTSPVVTTDFGAPAVSFDGKALLFPYWGSEVSSKVISLSTRTGERLAGSIEEPTPSGFRINPRLTLSPITNNLLLTGDYEPQVSAWSFDSATGGGSFLGVFCEGNSEFLFPRSVTNGSGVEAFVTVEGNTHSGYEVLRDVNTGGSLRRLPAYSAVSPDGLFYAVVDNGVRVYRMLDDKFIVSYAANLIDTAPISVHWDNPTKMAVLRKATSPTSPLQVEVLSFSGTNLTRQKAFAFSGDGYALSPDGNRLALLTFSFTTGGFIAVYNTATGALLGKVNGSPTNLVVRASFTTDGQMLVQRDDSTNLAQIYDVTAVPTLSKKLSQPYLGWRDNWISISPDGKYLAFASSGDNFENGRFASTIQIVRISDGAVVKQIENELLSQAPFIGERLQGLTFSADSSTLAVSGIGVLFGIEIQPQLSQLKFEPISVVGGNSTVGTVTLERAPASDLTVALATTSTTLTVPPSVTILAGSKTANFTVNTKGVDATESTSVVATINGIATTGVLSVTPPTAVRLSLDPTTVNGGSASTGTVTLNGLAGPSGVTVSLSSGAPLVASLPTSILVSANSSSGTFNISTVQPDALTIVPITATAVGSTATAELTVKRMLEVTLAFDKLSIKGGNALQLTVTITSAAPTGGMTFNLVSDAAPLAPPTTVTIPAGKTSVTVGVDTNPTLTDNLCTLTASDVSGPLKTATVTVQAPVIKTLSISVASVVGAKTIYALVQLDGPAPDGFTLVAKSNKPSVTLAGSVTVPKDRFSVEVPIAVTRVTVKTVVTITIGGKTVTLVQYP